MPELITYLESALERAYSELASFDSTYSEFIRNSRMVKLVFLAVNDQHIDVYIPIVKKHAVITNIDSCALTVEYFHSEAIYRNTYQGARSLVTERGPIYSPEVKEYSFTCDDEVEACAREICRFILNTNVKEVPKC